jgi:lysozyme
MNLEYTKYNEGYEPDIYLCTNGKRTIGIGLNLDAGIDEELAMVIFEYQMKRVHRFLSCFGFWYHLNEPRQTVLADMCFQMGRTGFNKFKKMIAALREGDFEEAANQILDSKYAKHDTPVRAKTNADAMRSGSF